jgi:hypothetical protein
MMSWYRTKLRLDLLLFCVVCDRRYMRRLRPIGVAPAVSKGNPLLSS